MIAAFDKMQANGNDFVLLDLQQSHMSSSMRDRDTIMKISDRIFGIGCDTVLLYEKLQDQQSPSDMVLLKVQFFNADGGATEICGNALRCLGLLMHMHHGISKCVARTKDCEQSHLVEMINSNNITVTEEKSSCSAEDIGFTKPIKDPLRLNVAHDLQLTESISEIFHAMSSCRRAACISVGNPHLVFFLEKLPSLEQAQAIGKQLTTHTLFKNGVNVSFARIIDHTPSASAMDSQTPGAIESITYERGAGLTMACGSGASAIALLAQLCGMMQSSTIFVHQMKGTLRVDVNCDGSYSHTGAAAHVFSGSICL
ncbi:MAG: diaminopimelate epimerase [Holosporaceae bacterium]|jgi:diaminopimelate epimerase|nr:diaminopimelate epimerase [Holosporaceae bacterium]